MDRHEIAVTGNDCAVARGKRDGGDHHVHLLQRPADALQLGEDPAVVLGRVVVVWPENQP
jgi:hypothetical protein